MLNSKFNQIIAMFVVIYAVLMFKIFGQYQELTAKVETGNWSAAIEREYVLGGMRQVTFVFGFAIVLAFVVKAYRRKANVEKAGKKAIQLAQSGKYKNSNDIIAAIDPEYRGAAQAWGKEFKEELDGICKISSAS